MTALDWPAAREAIDISLQRAREEIGQAVREILSDLGDVGRDKTAAILDQVSDSLDDIDQTVPPESDDE